MKRVPIYHFSVYSLLVMRDGPGVDLLARMQVEGRVPRPYRFRRPAEGRASDRTPGVARPAGGAASGSERGAP